MAIPTAANQADFSEMDNAGIAKEHWKIMFISGMGFFTDAYDLLFGLGLVVTIFLLPETKGKSLEELEELEEQPSTPVEKAAA